MPGRGGGAGPLLATTGSRATSDPQLCDSPAQEAAAQALPACSGGVWPSGPQRSLLWLLMLPRAGPPVTAMCCDFLLWLG